MLTLKDYKKALVSYYRNPDKFGAKLITYQSMDTDGSPITIPQAVLTYEKGKKKGVLVAIGPGIIGWSLCNTKEHDLEIIPGVEITVPGDVFDKEKGLSIALMRADIASTLSSKERKSFYQKVPFTLSNLFESVDERSERYFTYEDEEFKED